MPGAQADLMYKDQRYDSTGEHPHQAGSFCKEAVKPPAPASRMEMCMLHFNCTSKDFEKSVPL